MCMNRPKSMLVPLVILAVLSIVGGWFAAPAFWGKPDYFEKFLEPVFAAPERRLKRQPRKRWRMRLETPLAIVAVIAALLGLFAGVVVVHQESRDAGTAGEIIWRRVPDAAAQILRRRTVRRSRVRPLLWISTNVLWHAVDDGVIDGAVNGIADGTTAIGDGTRRTQSGNTRSYAVWVVVGAIVIVAVIFWPHVRPVLGVAR